MSRDLNLTSHKSGMQYSVLAGENQHLELPLGMCGNEDTGKKRIICFEDFAHSVNWNWLFKEMVKEKESSSERDNLKKNEATTSLCAIERWTYTVTYIRTGGVGVGGGDCISFLFWLLITALQHTCAVGNWWNRKFNLIGQGGGIKSWTTFNEHTAKPLQKLP